MSRWSGALAAALAALVVASSTSVAQDSLLAVPPAPPIRHILGLTFSGVRPFYRTYDVNVLAGDSTIRIGRRDVSLSEALLPDSSMGWMLTERRDGVVPGVDVVLLAADLRPVSWSATLGGSQLELDFDSDSMSGSSRGPRGGRATITAACPPDVVLSGAMLELLVSLLPLSASWADSVNVLWSDLAGTEVAGAELLVMGEDSVAVAGGPTRQAWLVGLNAEERRLVLWVDKQTGVAIKSQQAVPAHTGTLIEYRERPPAAGVLPPQ